MKRLTHVDETGRSRMVDIGSKELVRRTATGEGRLFISAKTQRIVREAGLPKGNPFEVARLAGIEAAKQTSHLIPLCHNINLDFVDVDIQLEEWGFLINSRVSCRWATGVEMEALTAVTVAALTLYDMCKAVDAELEIGQVRLLEKTKTPL